MNEEAKNIRADTNVFQNQSKYLFEDLNELNDDYFNSVLNVVLKNKQKYLGEMKPIDFLLNWKYEIVKILCTQKLNEVENQALVDKFKNLDFEHNKSELMKALQNLKVVEQTQKIILDDFAQNKGFESLDLKPFEQLEEECGTQVYNHDKNKTIFLPISNDFIKLCKVIWRIIKNTETEYKNRFMKLRYNASDLVAHINRVFTSETNKTFFKALKSFNDTWDNTLQTKKFEPLEDSQKAYEYYSGNDIFAYFNNLSCIKCIDTEYVEFANRFVELYSGLRRQKIVWGLDSTIRVDYVTDQKPYDRRPDNKIIIAQPAEEENDRRTTICQNIKKCIVSQVNSLAKKWNSLSPKTRKILSGVLAFVSFSLCMLACFNIAGIAAFMSLALSWTIAIISFIMMASFVCMFIVSSIDNSEMQPDLNLDSTPSPKTKKVLSGVLALVGFLLWTLAILNIMGIVTFMSLALSYTMAIISFIGTVRFGGMFVLLVTDDSENLQGDLSNLNNLDLDLNATRASENGDIDLVEIESDETPLIVIGLDKMENENNLSFDLQK